MKLIFLFAALLAASLTLHAQTYTESFVACGKSYTSVCEKKEGNTIKVTIVDGMNDSLKNGFTISTDDLDVFSIAFRRAFLALKNPPDPDCSSADSDKVLAYGRRLFISFKASVDSASTDLRTGIFKIKDSVHVYAKTCDTCRYMRSEKKYRILSVQVEINEGYIENILACISINGKKFYYSNEYGIGMSSKRNLDNFYRIKLYEQFSSPYSSDTGRTFYFVYLNNLIEYSYDLAVDRRDFSPRNIKFELNGGESIKLYKEDTKKLFQANIFTDFIGLNDDKPNGLVQTELSKKININTMQFQSRGFLYRLFKSYGFIQHITPVVAFSKIEEHNRQLVLRDLDSVRLNPGNSDLASFNKGKHRYRAPIDLYQYQHFSAGFTANMLFLSNHDLKYTFYLNAGIQLGITQVRDSGTVVSGGGISKTGQASTYSANSLQLYPEAIITWLPEERFNFSLAQRLVYYELLNGSVQMARVNKSDPTKLEGIRHAWLSITELLMTIQVNESSKLFGRLRFNADMKNFDANFAQVQVGYSVYILGKAKK